MIQLAMKKSRRLLFCIFALIACFQLIGLEEAFCDDTAVESGCQECMTCAGHQFTALSNPVSPPAITASGYSAQNYFLNQPEHPPLVLFRPPISR